jgi:hypothetical protein
MPGTVKAVYGLALRCKIICQKPAVRSMILKIVLPDHPILPMHLLTSFMEYLSVYDFQIEGSKVFDEVHVAVLLHEGQDKSVVPLRAG